MQVLHPDTELTGRIPPQSLDTERAILGTLTLKPEAVPLTLSLLTVEALYLQQHKEIFTAINSIFNAGGSVDLITVMNELTQTGKLGDIGGPAFLANSINDDFFSGVDANTVMDRFGKECFPIAAGEASGAVYFRAILPQALKDLEECRDK